MRTQEPMQGRDYPIQHRESQIENWHNRRCQERYGPEVMDLLALN